MTHLTPLTPLPEKKIFLEVFVDILALTVLNLIYFSFILFSPF